MWIDGILRKSYVNYKKTLGHLDDEIDNCPRVNKMLV